MFNTEKSNHHTHSTLKGYKKILRMLKKLSRELAAIEFANVSFTPCYGEKCISRKRLIMSYNLYKNIVTAINTTDNAVLQHFYTIMIKITASDKTYLSFLFPQGTIPKEVNVGNIKFFGDFLYNHFIYQKFGRYNDIKNDNVDLSFLDNNREFVGILSRLLIKATVFLCQLVSLTHSDKLSSVKGTSFPLYEDMIKSNIKFEPCPSWWQCCLFYDLDEAFKIFCKEKHKYDTVLTFLQLKKYEIDLMILILKYCLANKQTMEEFFINDQTIEP